MKLTAVLRFDFAIALAAAGVASDDAAPPRSVTTDADLRPSHTKDACCLSLPSCSFALQASHWPASHHSHPLRRISQFDCYVVTMHIYVDGQQSLPRSYVVRPPCAPSSATTVLKITAQIFILQISEGS